MLPGLGNFLKGFFGIFGVFGIFGLLWPFFLKNQASDSGARVSVISSTATTSFIFPAGCKIQSNYRLILMTNVYQWVRANKQQ